MVYFIAELNDDRRPSGNVKIGFSRTTGMTRVCEHQTGNPRRLCLLHEVSGTSWHEGQMHAHLAEWRLLGEWFALLPEAIAVLEEQPEVEAVELAQRLVRVQRRGEQRCF